jgi:hypothetical protein
MNNSLKTASDLAPIAKEMRERQLGIDRKGTQAMALIGEIIADISEQGRDVINAKTHLGKMMSFADWLEGNVPNLPPRTASKYERITVEGITDPRQAVFAFMPEPDQRELPKPGRSKPSFFENVLAHTYKLESLTKEQPVAAWPEDQREAARVRLRPLVNALWPSIDV